VSGPFYNPTKLKPAKNPSLSIPPKEFDFTDAEVVRIKAAIQTWDGYGAAADRRWLEPLLEFLFPAMPQT
jgi:hypothetical protein